MISLLPAYFRHINHTALLLCIALSLNAAIASDTSKDTLDKNGGVEYQYNPIQRPAQPHPNFGTGLPEPSAPPAPLTPLETKQSTWSCPSWFSNLSSSYASSAPSCELSTPIYAYTSTESAVAAIPVAIVDSVAEKVPTRLQTEYGNLCESLSNCGAGALGGCNAIVISISNCGAGAFACCNAIIKCPINTLTYCYNEWNCCTRNNYHAYGNSNRCSACKAVVMFYGIPVVFIVAGACMVNDALTHGARTVTYTCGNDSCSKCVDASASYCYEYAWGDTFLVLGCLGFTFVSCVFVRVAMGR